LLKHLSLGGRPLRGKQSLTTYGNHADVTSGAWRTRLVAPPKGRPPSLGQNFTKGDRGAFVGIEMLAVYHCPRLALKALGGYRYLFGFLGLAIAPTADGTAGVIERLGFDVSCTALLIEPIRAP